MKKAIFTDNLIDTQLTTYTNTAQIKTDRICLVFKKLALLN